MRSPRKETLDPQLSHELEVLEAELRPDLLALKPGVEQEFGRKLDAWAAEGFAGAEGPAGRLSSRLEGLRPRKLLLPALAGATAVIIVGTVVISSLGGGGGEDHGNPIGLQQPQSGVAEKVQPQ